jgi:mycothiol-dependent nitroreductase-like protein
MADVEFFFDPICPWAWITSRFTVEVARQRDLAVEWKFICLRMVNETKDYDREFPAGYVNAHGGGRRMLRIAAAAREAGGNDAVGRLYTELGERLHTGGRSGEIREADYRVIDDAVAAAGLPASLVARGEDEELDIVLHEETELGLSRTGKDVGTPILTFAPGTDREASIFGPVIARIPRGEEALRIWDAAELLVRTPGFAELKRSARDRPAFD